jgi:peptide/nickel transport system substrate-binding protein
VRGYGGPAAANATCQILPPQLPGHRRYCPYTRDQRPDERWRGPDLRRARQLVAQSGTKGMKVNVWTEPSLPRVEDNAVLTALRRLGYRASLALLPESRFFTFTADPDNHAQIIGAGWSADYPAASNFIGKLTCARARTFDNSGFCDPAIDRQIARATSLQATDTTSANALWARLDREITDRAIWLPTVTPVETDLVSTRVANYQYHPTYGALIDQLWVR